MRVADPAVLGNVEHLVFVVARPGTSNISAVTEMAGMIAARRAYKAIFKVIHNEAGQTDARVSGGKAA